MARVLEQCWKLRVVHRPQQPAPLAPLLEHDSANANGNGACVSPEPPPARALTSAPPPPAYPVHQRTVASAHNQSPVAASAEHCQWQCCTSGAWLRTQRDRRWATCVLVVPTRVRTRGRLQCCCWPFFSFFFLAACSYCARQPSPYLAHAPARRELVPDRHGACGRRSTSCVQPIEPGCAGGDTRARQLRGPAEFLAAAKGMRPMTAFHPGVCQCACACPTARALVQRAHSRAKPRACARCVSSLEAALPPRAQAAESRVQHLPVVQEPAGAMGPRIGRRMATSRLPPSCA